MKFFFVILFLVLKISHSQAGVHQAPFIEAYECEGPDETVAMDNGLWAEYHCTEGEWFMQLDGEQPITVRLEKSKAIQSDEFEFYTIVPTLPVNAKTRWILRRHWMRVSPHGEVDFYSKR